MILKKKSFFTSFCLLLMFFVILLYMNLSSCYAKSYPSAVLVEEINTNIEKVANYYGISYYPVYSTNGNIMYEPPITTYCIFVTASDSGWNANCIGAFFPGTTNLQPTYNGSQFLNNITTTLTRTNSNTNVGVSDWSVTKSAKFKYMYTQFNWASSTSFNYEAGKEYGADILLKPPFTIKTDLESVNVNTYDYNALRVNYNYTYCKIGYLDGIDDNMHFFVMSLSFTDNYSGEVLFNTKLYSTNSSSDLYMDDNYNIYVRNRLLQLNQPYVLYVDAYDNSTYDNLLGSSNLRLFTVAYNAVISNGSITYSGDASYNVQDSTNDIIGGQEQQTQDIIAYISDYNGASGEMAGFFSGNVLSGDIIGGIEMPHIRTW